ncbi:MAG TPA: diacylglycerol kinase family protein, partial [Vicinamibacterales bacterium]|nr:diacylglycerol kinase family protein [Vicinamibacterales bacterium]
PDQATLQRALRAAGVSASIFDAPIGDASDRQDDATSDVAPWLDHLAADHDVLVAAGGDGTVSAVANVAARRGKTLGIVPAGTMNHFARDANIPTEINRAALVIASGCTRGIDVGSVNGRLFLNNVSLGNYPRMVHARAGIEQRGVPHRIAGAIAAARTWWSLRNLAAAITVDGHSLIRRSPFIVIANGRYVLAGLSLTRRQQINDGSLSLYVAPATGRLGALVLPFRALIGTLESHEQFESFRAMRITVGVGRAEVRVAIDGEVLTLQAPLEFTIRRQTLRVLVAGPQLRSVRP